MKGLKIINFIGYIAKISLSEGRKRVSYALLNIVLLVVAFFSLIGVRWSFNYMLNTSFVIGLLVLIITIAFLVYSSLMGVVSQIALLFVSLFGSFRKEGRKYNIIAFILALVSLSAVVVGAIFALRWFRYIVLLSTSGVPQLFIMD